MYTKDRMGVAYHRRRQAKLDTIFCNMQTGKAHVPSGDNQRFARRR